MSKDTEEYLSLIQSHVNKCYEIASEAREKGLDPENFVESPQAKDLAGRVEKLVGPEGVAEEIRRLKIEGKSDDFIVFKVVSDILEKKIGNIEKLDDRVERAIRVGLAIKTMGVVSAPLEGISQIMIKKEQQGNKYLSLYFAGPIRAAGGTTAGLCVLIADFVRRKSDIPEYQATDGEIGRYVEEVKLYDRRVHLQYPSSNDEIRYAVEHLPVEINGDPTEREEVSAFRDLPRIETNTIRGGACLVLNDGILLKAPKLLKIAKKMNLEGWDWLANLKKIAAKGKKEISKPKSEVENEKSPKDEIVPNKKYIADIIAGRPVFGYPSRIGGHRIRYGRSRNTGLAAGGFHPATMVLLDNFVAIGTQLRIERPGKSTSICPVNYIEPPIVKLKNGNVVRVKSRKKAKKLFPQVKKILFLGDILFGYGEFSENNHKLLPSGYVEEWWALELEEAIKKNSHNIIEVQKFIDDPFRNIPTAKEAIIISRKLQIPLHPRYIDFWGNLTIQETKKLHIAFLNGFNKEQGVIELEFNKEIKKVLEKAFILHNIQDNKIYFSKAMNYIYKSIFALEGNSFDDNVDSEDIFSYFYNLSKIKIKDKAPYFMGTRMGRPEKSERKSMKGIHSLFPLSEKVGSSRSFEKALEIGKIKIDVCRKKCPKCGTITIFNLCSKCGTHTQVNKICTDCKKLYTINEENCHQCGNRLVSSSEAVFNFTNHVNVALKKLGFPIPKKVKGVYGLTNNFKVPEPLEKGLLRSKNEVLVYKTAEIRYDATDIPLTHFMPKEIGTSIESLIKLGYREDIHGKPLTKHDQILELKVQDILLSLDSAQYFVKVAQFIDEELESFYEMQRFYNVKKKEDLVGHLVVGLAPHTSAGIIGRIIGFSPARSIYAHPYWHAAKRRNCFPGNTKVLVEKDNEIRKIRFKDLYHQYFENEYFDKMSFVKEKSNCKIQVFSFDKKSGQILRTNIKNVIKIPNPKELINFKLSTGRNFKTTPDHPVIVYSNGTIIEKKAVHVTKNDKFLLPTLKFPIKDKKEFDLIEQFNQKKFQFIWDDLMIRGIRDFIKKLVYKWGLKKTAQKLNINKKTLNNYYSKRDSIPFNILKKILDLHNLTIRDIPNCLLGFKRDHTSIKRYIAVNKSLMKICGYYIAEGFYRETQDGCQVDLAVSEEDIRQDMLESIKVSFGEGFKPYVNKNRITISNRVLYYFFKEILKFKKTAREKSIPSFFFNLPKDKIKYFLAAYFSGDGGLDITHKTVVCSSFSSRLIQDLDLMLLRYSIFSAISKHKRNKNIEYKLRIRGKNVFKYHKQIGFTSNRKSKVLNYIIKNKKTISEAKYEDHRLLKIKDIQASINNEDYVYSLHAEKFHTIIVNENIITSNCDGDEDGVMLLLDPLLNFSRFYLPSKIGGRMDATLVISSVLDPNEIDVEAHNVDTLFKYPLEFYKATERFASPSEIEEIMDLVKSRLGTSRQYEGLGYNIPTDNINAGPTMTAYKTHESMDDKIEAQLHLAKIIRAVDAKNVAKKILSSHFNPDILGNLRKFSVQEFRCVKCNTKYRRPPLSNNGKCPSCNNNIILTVNSGGIEKYIPRAIKLCEEFKLDSYTNQRMKLIEQYVMSLTNNPRIKQQKLSDFF